MKEMCLTLQDSNALAITWWVYGSYSTHADMRSHTGAMMSLWKGAVYSTSQKKKINTNSSTEAEIIAVNDALSQVLCTLYFMSAQGYKIEKNLVNQDNISALMLENNRKESSGKRTSHMEIRYFFIKDRIDARQVQMQHFPTELMVDDYFTKPLQGNCSIVTSIRS